ncbi:hypothetical protein CFP71_09965 [Amycolatopsis thailandensis]|uniref:Recombinase RecT n=1 Tax=Amycolatopsis thailandensis TaxID=589330 RepID=A0A229SDQ5_9PSEU|nr:hypothetical protein [Amycolatopsis thailandensis]OXM57052.1 hypothetical protein CFP71_09965 [Amycolatopsis thailandensis]
MDTTELRAQLAETHRARRGELVPVQRELATPTADVLDTDQAYAEHLAKSVLLPSHYRRQPANILWAVEFGRMLSIPAMTAMLGVYVVDGSPTARASLIGFLVRRAGHKLRVRGGQSWKEPAFAEIIRKDDPDFTFRSDWTVKRAHESRLLRLDSGLPVARDSKGKPMPWERFTPALLKARAITEVARDACQDALYGLQYTPEELGADIDQHGIPTGHLLEVGNSSGYHRENAVTLDEAMERAQQYANPASEQATTAEPERERVVITTPPPAVDPAADDDVAEEDVLNTDPIDWDAALTEAARHGADALRELWWVAKRAEPDNVELRKRINAAGAQLAEATEEPAAAASPRPSTPDPATESVPGE